MATKAQQIEGAQFVRYFGPLLDALRTLGGSGTPREVVEQIARDLAIPDDTQNELLPSGEPRFPNQVAWARFYLTREGLLDSSRRGVWSLTDKGRSTVLSPEEARGTFLKGNVPKRVESGMRGRLPSSSENGCAKRPLPRKGAAREDQNSKEPWSAREG